MGEVARQGSLPERAGKLVGGRAYQQTPLPKAVGVDEKTLVWKKNHPLTLAVNTWLCTHIHSLSSCPFNPDSLISNIPR